MKATVIPAPAVPEPTAETSSEITSPATKSQFAAVRVPWSFVPAAAIEKAAATSEPTLRSAVRAEPAGAVVTATHALVILPLKGSATAAMLLVVSVPGIVRVTVVGASDAVDMIYSCIRWWLLGIMVTQISATVLLLGLEFAPCLVADTVVFPRQTGLDYVHVEAGRSRVINLVG